MHVVLVRRLNLGKVGRTSRSSHNKNRRGDSRHNATQQSLPERSLSCYYFQFSWQTITNHCPTMNAIGNSDGVNAAHTQVGWDFIVLMSRQGKIRLSEFFKSYTESEKRRILRDIAADILPRAPKMCNIIEKGRYKFVYRRYASLYFIIGVPVGMNELIVLEQIHLFVEALDGYFKSGTLTVCKNN